MALTKLIDQYWFVLDLLSQIFVDQYPRYILTVQSVSFVFRRATKLKIRKFEF